MTLVLAIESATDAAGVAVADDEGLLALAAVGRGRRHAETIAPAVVSVCRAAGVDLDALDAIAVDVGPGLFTGLRVGIATAKGLAFARSVPIVAVTSLDVLAGAAAAARPERPLVAVVDARRGEVFWAWYDGAGGAPLDGPPGSGVPRQQSSPRVGPPQDLADEVRARGPAVLAVGDGAVRYGALLTEAGAGVAGPVLLAHPPVAALAAIGVARWRSGGGQPADEVRAEYLRDADARSNWVRR